jgi:uncharacterized protein
MVVYLDTSSLVKLYVEEDESPWMCELIRSSKVVATSIVAYAEARAAFARRFREKAFSREEYDRLKDFFEKDWNDYLIITVTDDLVKLAAILAEKHALRGFDSIHLASAVILQREIASQVLFSCFDDQLQKASAVQGLTQNSPF